MMRLAWSAIFACVLGGSAFAQVNDSAAAPSPTEPGTVVVSPAAPGAADESAIIPTMTLEDAIAMALERNELVQQNAAGAAEARARVREVRSSGLPRVTVTGQIQRQKEVSTVFQFPDPVTGDVRPTRIVLNPATSRVANANLQQLIDVFGVVRRARDIADIGARVQQLNVARARSEVIYRARTDYHNVLRAAGAVEVALATVSDAEEQLRLARAFVEAGTAPRFDVTRAEVQLADRQQTLIAARDGLALAGAALNNTLGRPVDTPLQIAPVDQPTDRSVDIAAQTERALGARPEIAQADLGVRANEENVGLQRLNNYPTFALGANYNYNFTATGFSAEKGNWSFGVSAAWPVWDSGETRAKVDQAQARVRQSELQREALRRGITLQVRQAGLRVTETADRQAVAEQAVTLAEEALRLARVRYQNGVSTQLEVTDAETALSQARFNNNAARYDHLDARAAFDAAVLGRLNTP